MVMPKGKERIVHIREQKENHQDAYIFGNRAGLETVKETLERALRDGQSECVLMPKDEENYKLFVRMNNEDLKSDFWQQMQVPYCVYDDDEMSMETYHDYSIKKSEDIPKAREAIAYSASQSKEVNKKIQEIMIKKWMQGNDKLFNLEVHLSESDGFRIEQYEYRVLSYNEDSGFFLVTDGENSSSVNSRFINQIVVNGLDGLVIRLWCDEKHLEKLKSEIPSAIQNKIEQSLKEVQTIEQKCISLLAKLG